MRWFASLFVLALTMALFHRLTEAGPLEARAALALGFLLLAALLAGDLSRRWRLPRLTGFLLVGFCVGPAWLGLVREDEVAALRFIADAALALLALALGKAVAGPGALNLTLAGTAAVHLFGSVAVGLVVGVLLGTYLRLISGGTTLFLIAAGFLTAAVARGTGLETMLIGLAAGCTLENFSRAEGERLRAELQRSLLPVEVVFFAIAGAGLRLQVLGELWPWILLLVGLPVSSLRAVWRWPGRHPLLTGDLARYGWGGLVSQAGTVLGLAQIARRAFPEWGVSLEALIVAMIGVPEVGGPLWLRAALVQVGEVTEGEHVAANSHGDGSAVVAARGGL